MSEENRKRNATAAAQQKQAQRKREERDAFDNLGLTKRNAEYMFRFKQQLDQLNKSAEEKQSIVDEMVAKLVATQKQGGTARNLYGTVEQRIDAIVNPPKQKQRLTSNYWPNAIYNFLIFLSIFMLLYGITDMLAKNTSKQAQAAGIVGILITSAFAGAGMPIITRLFDPNVQHTRSGWTRAGGMLLMVLVWLVVFYTVVLLPAAVNPVLPPIVNIVIAVISFGASFWMRSKYQITTGLFMPREPRQK